MSLEKIKFISEYDISYGKTAGMFPWVVGVNSDSYKVEHVKTSFMKKCNGVV